jgi:hypothetical protein
VDLANTRADVPDIPLDDTWAVLKNPTAADYGALMIALTDNGGGMTPAQLARFSLGVGALNAEVEIFRQVVQLATSAALVQLAPAPVINRFVPANSRIVGRVKVGSASTSKVRAILYGCVA